MKKHDMAQENPSLEHLWAQMPSSKRSRRGSKRLGVNLAAPYTRVLEPHPLTLSERFEGALRSSTPQVLGRDLILLGLERMGL